MADVKKINDDIKLQVCALLIKKNRKSGVSVRQWCEDNINKTLSGFKLFKAFQYALHHKQGLCEYINDEYLPMTNSLDERVIRPFTTGRKN